MAKQSVILELDRPRSLRFGLNALVRIEEMIGKPISRLDLDNISVKDMRTIIYAGLFYDDKNLTPEKVGELIDDFSDINTVAEKLSEAMTEAFGRKNGKKPTAGKEKTGTGTGS